MSTLSALVLAAGSGARMQSTRPKPLHLLCGRPMLLYALDALGAVRPARTVVVVGHGAERITKRVSEDLPDLPVDFVEQAHPRGSADAAYAGLAGLDEDDLGDDDVVVMVGDMPLLSGEALAALVEHHRESDAGCTLLTATAPTAARNLVVRGKGGRIVKVCNADQAGLDDVSADEIVGDEVAADVYLFRRSVLGPALRRIAPDPLAGEFRLHAVVEVLQRAGYPIGAMHLDDPGQLAEVNDRVSLAAVEAELRRRINHSWLERGVTFVDPATAYVDATVTLARDVTVFPNTLLQGRTVVGEGAEIGPDTRLVDCMVGAGAKVHKTSGQDAEVGPGAVVGPYAVLEPGAQVVPGTRVAPFTTVGEI
jgi:bifunctional UDP-N-acetylglucosamine pyrophosphorylase/glucosamine-1-phosphate N-acetyltransferase